MSTMKSRKRTFEEYSDSEEQVERPSKFSNSVDDQSGASESESENASDSENNSEAESVLYDSEQDDDEVVKQRLNTVSFGALVKAQNALEKDSRAGKTIKRDGEANPESEGKLATLRERLRELKAKRTDGGGMSTKTQGYEQEQGSKDTDYRTERIKSRRGKDEHASKSESVFFEEEQQGQESDSDASSQDSEAQGPRKRSSKHAPTAMPANRAVGRYRNVVNVNKVKSRDPRFDVTSGVLDKHTVSQRYSFINDYQASEVSELRRTLKDKKIKLSEGERENIQRKIISLESRISAAKAKERESNVVRAHRKKEKELVGQGKQPFFLKKGDIKKQALTERFEGMKSRQRDKVMERRRKKLASRERRDMPLARRG